MLQRDTMYRNQRLLSGFRWLIRFLANGGDTNVGSSSCFETYRHTKSQLESSTGPLWKNGGLNFRSICDYDERWMHVT
jgi:hypothetical protein